MEDSKRNDPAIGALADAILAGLRLANLLAGADQLARQGIGLREWAVLDALPADGTNVPARKLVQLTGIDPGSLKIVVSKLESLGLVESVALEAGQRARRYGATQMGRALRSGIRDLLRELQATSLDPSQGRALERARRIFDRIDSHSFHPHSPDKKQ